MCADRYTRSQFDAGFPKPAREPLSKQIVGPAMQLGSDLGALSYTLLHVVLLDKEPA